MHTSSDKLVVFPFTSSSSSLSISIPTGCTSRGFIAPFLPLPLLSVISRFLLLLRTFEVIAETFRSLELCTRLYTITLHLLRRYDHESCRQPRHPNNTKQLVSIRYDTIRYDWTDGKDQRCAMPATCLLIFSRWLAAAASCALRRTREVSK